MSTLLKRITAVCFTVIFSATSYAIPPLPDNKLVSYTFLGVVTEQAADAALQKIPPLSDLKAHNAVNLYKINYRTPAPDGHSTLASGLVAMPVSPEKKVGIVSY